MKGVIDYEKERKNNTIYKKQVNVDLSAVRTDFKMKFERRNEIIVEYGELDKSDWRKVEILAATKKIIRIEDDCIDRLNGVPGFDSPAGFTR